MPSSEFPVDPVETNLFVDWGDDAPLKGAGDLARAIEALPPELQDAINGVFWEQTDLTEIGAREGVSRHVVRRRLREALAILRETCERDER